MTTKSFIKTIGEKGLLADYNTEGKKLLTELTSGTYGIDISGNAATASAAASGSALETAINAKANGDNSVAIFDGYMRRMNESAGWRRVAYKQFNNTNTNLNALFRLYLIGSNNEHIGLGDLIVNIRFNSSGSAPDFKTCYLMSNKPLNTSIKLKVVGVAGNAVVEVWFRPPTFSLLMLSCIGNGYDVNANTKDWTFGKYLSSTDPEPVEDIANNVYVFSGTVKRVQLDIDNPTDGNLVAMDEKGLVKDSGIRITSSNIANWNGKQNSLTFDTTPTAGSNNPVTSDGIKTAIDSAAGSATAKKFTGYNTSNIVTGSWYIIALKNGGVGEWERLYEFLIGSNDNSSEQMRVLFSPRISSKGTFDDSKVFISGHIIKNTSLLENWKFATLKDTAGTTYTALCVKGTNSTSSRSVYWNVRSVRGNNDWIPVSINLDTTKDYTKVSELPFNGPNSLPNCITTDSVTMNKSGNEFNASLPITSGAMFGYLTDNACKPSKAIILPCGGANITQTGGSWTSTWRQKDCILDGNGMLDVTASFGINIINQHTYVATITSGTCALCDWNGNVVASAEFTMPKHIDNTLVYTITDNVSLRFVVPACESNFNNGLKVVITLPSNYTIDDQVNISNFTLNGTYWRNGTGYNSNTITFDS